MAQQAKIILNLPLLIQQNIFDNVSCRDYAHFTFLSRRCLRLTLSLKKKDITDLRYNLEEYPEVTISDNDSRVTLKPIRLEDFESLVKLVFKLFNVQNISLNAGETLDLKTCFIMKMEQLPTKIHLSGGPANLKFALEEHKFDSVSISATVPGELGKLCSTALLPRSVTLDTCHWLGIEALLNSESDAIFIREDSLSVEQLRMIIDKWRSGGLRNLKYFIQSTSIRERNQMWAKLQEIMSGIPVIAWDGNVRPENYCFTDREESFKHGMDFKREDGSELASVKLNYRGFVMVVWKAEDLIV